MRNISPQCKGYGTTQLTGPGCIRGILENLIATAYTGSCSYLGQEYIPAVLCCPLLIHKGYLLQLKTTVVLQSHLGSTVGSKDNFCEA